MATWQKTNIKRDNGMMAEAQAPIIISASRSTDIPAFYADWFFNRLKVGYSAWTNPFNGVKSFVSYEKCRFIVFWSKNPEPLLGHLDELKERNICSKAFRKLSLCSSTSDCGERMVMKGGGEWGALNLNCAFEHFCPLFLLKPYIIIIFAGNIKKYFKSVYNSTGK